MRTSICGRLQVVLCLGLISVTSILRAEETADHQALRNLVGVYEEAIAKSDPAVLEPYLATDFSGVMVTSDSIDSFKSLEAYWQKIQALLGKNGSYHAKIDVPQPATIVGDLAFANGTSQDVVTTGAGRSYSFTGQWTAVCRKEGSDWKIVRIHGSMDPVRNSFVLRAISAASWSSGILGAVVGLVLGIAGTVCVRRTRPRNK